jgi:hypothetical protein
VSCVLDLHSTTQVVSRLHVTVFCVKVVQSKSVLKFFIASRKSLKYNKKTQLQSCTQLVHKILICFSENLNSSWISVSCLKYPPPPPFPKTMLLNYVWNVGQMMATLGGGEGGGEILHEVKVMLHAAIFLATCNAILLLRDVKLPNTSLHYTPLMFSQHIENSSLISLINISQEQNCIASCKKNCTV